MVGPRTLVALAVLVLAVPAQGSLLEQSTGGVVSYQFDANNHHDAPDACQQATSAWSLPIGARADAVLLPPDDLSDAFVLDVPADLVGDRIALHVRESVASVHDLQVATYVPGCLSDVFAPANQPTYGPNPPAPTAGQTQHEASRIDEPQACTDDARTFRLDGVPRELAPASIHVAWTNGAERTVSRFYGYSEGVAYRTTDDLDVSLHGAWANVADPDAALVLVQGPCGAADGGVVFGAPPEAARDGLSFTPVRAGPYVVVVTVGEAALPGSTTMTCHYCVDGADEAAEKVAYYVETNRTGDST